MYSDKTWVFDQSESAQSPIYTLMVFILDSSSLFIKIKFTKLIAMITSSNFFVGDVISITSARVSKCEF